MSPNVALFVTCLTDQFYPSTAVAVTKILRKYGCQVSFPQAQTCCGQPFFNNGFHKEAADLGKRFIEIFEGFDYIVTPSGSCCAMVREQYHQLFEHDAEWGPRMEATRHKTFEFVEFLDRILKADLAGLKMPTPGSYTYHYTCHQRGLGLKDESVKLLQQIDGVTFVPLEKTDQCCGFGGTFAVKYPEISEAIVDDKVQCIEATHTGTTVCNDAGCTMNISGMCHRKGVDVKVRHIADILAEAMGLDTTRL